MLPHTNFHIEAYETGDNSIKTIALSNHVPNTEKPPITIVFGNGAASSIRTFGPVIRTYLTAATQDNQLVKAITYKDPWLGSGVYAEDHRIERLDEIVRNTAQETPVQIAGHSWSWLGATQVAESSPTLISALQGYVPTGHRGEAAPELNWFRLFGSAARETMQLGNQLTKDSIKSLGALGMSFPARVLVSNGIKEAQGTFDNDVTHRVLSLRRIHNMPIGIVYAEKDAFFKPPAHIIEKLHQAGVLIKSINTTHLGSVTEPKYGASLYDLSKTLSSSQNN